MAFGVFWASAIARSKLPARETSHATLITAKVENAAPPNPVPQEKQKDHKEGKALVMTEKSNILVLRCLTGKVADGDIFSIFSIFSIDVGENDDRK
jgi:hypothetical protein